MIPSLRSKSSACIPCEKGRYELLGNICEPRLGKAKSHLLSQVQSVCDRVALFYKGPIVLIGTVPALARQVLGGGVHVEVEAVGQERRATQTRRWGNCPQGGLN